MYGAAAYGGIKGIAPYAVAGVKWVNNAVGLMNEPNPQRRTGNLKCGRQ